MNLEDTFRSPEDELLWSAVEVVEAMAPHSSPVFAAFVLRVSGLLADAMTGAAARGSFQVIHKGYTPPALVGS